MCIYLVLYENYVALKKSVLYRLSICLFLVHMMSKYIDSCSILHLMVA